MKIFYFATIVIALYSGLLYTTSSVYSDAGVVATSNVSPMEPASAKAGVTGIGLTDLLEKLGAKYDYYFTLETALKSGKIDTSLELDQVDVRADVRTIDAALEQLRQANSDFTYEFSERNAKVIHVIDNRLKKVDDYSMDRLIPRIEFEGRLADYVDALGNAGGGVSGRGLIDIREASTLDYATLVKVNEQRENVRFLLTKVLEVRTRPRVMWIARTDIERKGTATFVRYPR